MAERFASATLMFADTYNSPLPGFDQIYTNSNLAASLPSAATDIVSLYNAPLTGVDQVGLLSGAGELPDASQRSLYIQHIEPPVITPGSGTFTGGSKQITLSCPTPGVTIYYTTNGTQPTTASNQYSAPFNITTGANRTIKAIAVKAGLPNSEITKAVITVTA